MTNHCIHILIVACLLPLSASLAEDQQNRWPRYRGPHGTAVSNLADIPSTWSDKENIAWKVPLPGPGLSSPIVWDNHIYVTCFTGFNWPKEHNQKKLVGVFKRHLICIDLDTGKIKWQKSHEAKHLDPKLDLADGYWQVRAHGFASNTPTCDKDGVYAYFGADGLHAFSHDGEKKWSRSCGEGHNRTGSAASPVVVDGIVIVNAAIESGRLFGIDTNNGDVVWQLNRHSEYSTPTTRHRNGRTTVMVRSSNGGTLKELDPRSGKELWQSHGGLGPSRPSVIIAGEKIITLSNLAEISVQDADGKSLWKVRGGPYFGTPVFHDGRLYYVGGGIFSCIDVDSGNILYRERIPAKEYFYASPLVVNGKVYCVSRENGTCVMAASAQFKLLAHNKIESDESYFNGTPAVTTRGLILRSNRFLYCIRNGS